MRPSGCEMKLVNLPAVSGYRHHEEPGLTNCGGIGWDSTSICGEIVEKLLASRLHLWRNCGEIACSTPPFVEKLWRNCLLHASICGEIGCCYTCICGGIGSATPPFVEKLVGIAPPIVEKLVDPHLHL